MSKFHLILLLHSHQPVGNFDDVFESCYQQSYLPFVEMLHKHPSIRVGLHYSGPLLEWIEQKHPEFFDLLRELIQRNQAEMIGGGFYEPILISIPPEDRHDQIRRLADYLDKHFGRRPSGAWLAERVWEPQLPSTFARAGVDYTLVDNLHFLAAGFEPSQLHGYYVAEDLGAKVKVIPGRKELRYLIPFRTVEENIAFLRAEAEQHPGGFACMGDDCEKFGVWPGTHKHCYVDGWLERFFVALEENSDWLSLTPPGEYLAMHPALGRADLPTASYTEMTEWALPTKAREKFHALQQELTDRPEAQPFLRGGFWRGFFSKYEEVNLLHKKMLHVSEKVRRMASSTRRGMPLRQALEDASTHLLRAQCNDAYWHGIFGGIYAPHLRTVLWRELIRAEKLADAAEQARTSYAELSRLDFDCDGREDLYFISDQYAALLKPSDGATLALLDYRPPHVTLVNSIQRRVEPYHAKVQHPETAAHGALSIHEQVRSKEQGLEKFLRYDRWPRHAFRVLVFPQQKTFADYEAVTLDESAAFASGDYVLADAGSEGARLTRVAPLPFPGANGAALQAEKSFTFARTAHSFSLTCELALTWAGLAAMPVSVGLEMVLNLLAPGASDRYIEHRGERHSLRWAAAAPASELRLVDEWQNVAIVLEATRAREFWIAPIETVSESEEGFERVYQGSSILSVWPVELQPEKPWTARVTLKIAQAR